MTYPILKARFILPYIGIEKLQFIRWFPLEFCHRRGLAPIVADILRAAQGCGRLASGVIAGQERQLLLAPAPVLAKIAAKAGLAT